MNNDPQPAIAKPHHVVNVRGYEVQFELPVDNPVHNVRVKRQQHLLTFFVPVNHPFAHSMGLSDLLQAVEASGVMRKIHRP